VGDWVLVLGTEYDGLVDVDAANEYVALGVNDIVRVLWHRAPP
jgi:hypothetical protein